MQSNLVGFTHVLGLYQRTLVLDHASLLDVSNDCTLNHIPHCESFGGLVLGHAAIAVGAVHELNVATTFLVAALTPSFLCLGS